jgi:hypothetical protein
MEVGSSSWRVEVLEAHKPNDVNYTDGFGEFIDSYLISFDVSNAGILYISIIY